MEDLFFFEYRDFLTGKVFVKKIGERKNKPLSTVFEEYGYIEAEMLPVIDQKVESANNGDFISSIETLLLVSYFLENEWPLPKSLSKYIAKTLNRTVISFGHANDVTSRNSNIAKTLGLVVPRGNAKRSASLKKKMLIYSYMFWRMKIFDENLYTSAKKAVIAFNGTEGLSQDYCEKIYNEMESDIEKYPCNLFNLDVSYLFYSKMIPLMIKPVSFNDDEFLKAMLPYAQDNSQKKLWSDCLNCKTPAFGRVNNDVDDELNELIELIKKQEMEDAG